MHTQKCVSLINSKGSLLPGTIIILFIDECAFHKGNIFFNLKLLKMKNYKVTINKRIWCDHLQVQPTYCNNIASIARVLWREKSRIKRAHDVFINQTVPMKWLVCLGKENRCSTWKRIRHKNWRKICIFITGSLAGVRFWGSWVLVLCHPLLLSLLLMWLNAI